LIFNHLTLLSTTSPQRDSNPPRETGLNALRARIAGVVIGLTSGGDSPSFVLSDPPGDPGLFGPDSVCWRVHSDFTAMLVGGVSALLLQALHPLPLGAVWDYSGFREDMLGRLRATASFITGTTYASRRDAEKLIAHVRGIHSAISGTLPDGRAYSANDPDLLTWVHVAEMNSFLRAYLRYVNRDLSAADQDSYFDEVAVVAEGLGATDVPRSRAEVEDYLQAMRPQLAYSERTREVIHTLLHTAPPKPAYKPAGVMLLQAGVDLLPAWAQQITGLHRWAGVRRAIVRPGVRSMAPIMRWGVRRKAVDVARERVASA
jgi:uncharacterized protein (DUF2236 family)